jgi:F-type H+-transporting ATPase subunit delta
MRGRRVDPLGAVYADALAGAVEAAGGLDLLREVGERLEALGAAWLADRTLRAYFLSAEVTAREKEAVLGRLADPQPHVLGNFLRLLLRRGRLDRLPEIVEAYEAVLDDRLGRVPVTLTTAMPVPEDMLRAWTERLRTATGREPLVRHQVRADLLSGAVVQVGDVIADGSGRRRLAEWKHQIIERGTHALQA